MPTPFNAHQIRHGITYGEWRVFLGHPRHCICTNASSGSSIAEFLVTSTVRMGAICRQMVQFPSSPEVRSSVAAVLAIYSLATSDQKDVRRLHHRLSLYTACEASTRLSHINAGLGCFALIASLLYNEQIPACFIPRW